ncbi:MAG: BsuBI/PstI family type II restriction endonuclease, partial [Gemmatimonas sp.]
MSHEKITTAMTVLQSLGLPRAQLNERSALCLLAVLDLTPDRSWGDALAPLMGITPIMDWAARHYQKQYAPNTRETFRRQTLHQFMAAGIVLYNPDEPTRPVNSPHAVYQIAPDALSLMQSVGKEVWQDRLAAYLSEHKSLAERYKRDRDLNRVAVTIAPGTVINISPGDHSLLIKGIIEEFGSRFVPAGVLIYAGDTGDKMGYFDEVRLKELGVAVDRHGKMPDVVIYCPKRNWLLLVESVTSHGPVDSKRHDELISLFGGSRAGLVYVTAFPSRA